MRRLSRSVAILAQRIPLHRLQDFAHRGAARARRRRGDDRVAAVGAIHRRVPIDRVAGEVLHREQSAAGLARLHHLLGDRAAVERLGALAGDRLQRLGEVGLHQPLARLPRLPMVEEDRRDIRFVREILHAIVHDLHVAGREDESLFGKRDGRGDHLFQGHRAIFGQRFVQAHHRARNAYAQPRSGRATGHHIAVLVLKQRRGGLQRRLLAEIKEQVLARGEVHDHEAATADIAAARIDHGLGITHRDRGIDGVAAFLQDLNADIGRQMLVR